MINHNAADNHYNHNQASRFVVLFTSLTLLFLLGGCGATKKNVRVDKNYSGKVSELFLRIDNAAMVQHKMTLSSRAPKITPEFKAAMARGARVALQKMRTVAIPCLTQALESHGVSVKDQMV